METTGKQDLGPVFIRILITNKCCFAQKIITPSAVCAITKRAIQTDAESAQQGAFVAPTNPKLSIDTIVQ